MKKALLILIIALLGFDASAQIGLGFGRKKTTTNDNTVDYGNPNEYTVAGISVTGAQFLDENSLISMTGLKIGDKIRIPGESISNIIRKLWKQGLLGDIQIAVEKTEGDKVWLQLILAERPRLSKFVFEGTTKSQASSLTDKIKLIKGKIVNDVMIKNTENTVKQYYIDKGFKNTEVKIVQKKDTLLSSHVQLVIKVDRKEKVKIGEIQFIGVAQVPESKIRKKMKKTKQDRKIQLSSSKFLAKEFEKDKGNVISYYNKLGFRNAEIEYDSIVNLPDGNVKLVIKINEGNKFYYRNINWEGNMVYSDKTLSDILGINKGQVYNQEELDKRLKYNPMGTDITSLYMDDGYLFFSVNPVEVQIDGDSIDIEMRVYEGDQATIRAVTIEGNTRTSDHVVLREVRTLPGQKFSRADLIRTQRELATLGYFDPEQIGIEPRPNMQNGTVDVHYRLVEKPSDQVELSGGWGGAFGFVGTLGLVFNNFSARKMLRLDQWSPLPQGDGQKLQLRMQANGRQFQTYSFVFTEPWLGGKKPHNFSVSLQRSVQRRLNYRTRETLGTMNVSGITLTLGRRLQFPDDFFTMSNSISYLRYDLKNISGYFKDVSTGDFNNVVFNTTVSRNSIDNPIFPRSGANVTLSIALTPPYSKFRPKDYSYTDLPTAQRFKWVEYHKWMFDNWWYTTIAGNLVLCARAHMGFIGAYNPKIGISPFERFIMGGDGLAFNNFLLGQDIIGLRGYQNRSIVPTSEGGVVFNKYVLDLRYPLTLSQAASVYALVFAEAGNNWGSFKEFNPFDLKRSAGVGARIFMPAFGLIGVDYGIGFDEIAGKPKANGAQFHFTIGQTLR